MFDRKLSFSYEQRYIIYYESKKVIRVYVTVLLLFYIQYECM